MFRVYRVGWESLALLAARATLVGFPSSSSAPSRCGQAVDGTRQTVDKCVGVKALLRRQVHLVFRAPMVARAPPLLEGSCGACTSSAEVAMECALLCRPISR